MNEIKRRSTNSYPLPAVAEAFGLSAAWLRRHVRAGTLRRELRGGPHARRQTYYLRPLDVDELLRGGDRHTTSRRSTTAAMKTTTARTIARGPVPKRF